MKLIIEMMFVVIVFALWGMACYRNGYLEAKKEQKENKEEFAIAEFESLRAELHETAEMHIDGDYYLCDEWIDEYIDNHIAELKGENNE